MPLPLDLRLCCTLTLLHLYILARDTAHRKKNREGLQTAKASIHSPGPGKLPLDNLAASSIDVVILSLPAIVQKGAVHPVSPAMIWTAAAGVLLLLFLLYTFYGAFRTVFWVVFRGSALNQIPNPFQRPSPRREGGLETDQTARDKILKQGFSEDLIPRYVDAIVIGSGMGGLTAAAVLSKAGKRVLVLEQHDQAGGCCHTFIDKGFEFDVGIHYVGKMAQGTFSRHIVDQISNYGIDWVKLEDVFDKVIIGLGGDSAKSKMFPIPSGKNKLQESLLKSFPSEEKAILKYFDLLKRLQKSGSFMPLLKLLPRWFVGILIRSGLLRWYVPELEYYQKSLSQVLDGLTDNQELKAVLTYSFGDYGRWIGWGVWGGGGGVL